MAAPVSFIRWFAGARVCSFLEIQVRRLFQRWNILRQDIVIFWLGILLLSRLHILANDFEAEIIRPHLALPSIQKESKGNPVRFVWYVQDQLILFPVGCS